MEMSMSRMSNMGASGRGSLNHQSTMQNPQSQFGSLSRMRTQTLYRSTTQGESAPKPNLSGYFQKQESIDRFSVDTKDVVTVKAILVLNNLAQQNQETTFEIHHTRSLDEIHKKLISWLRIEFGYDDDEKNVHVYLPDQD